MKNKITIGSRESKLAVLQSEDGEGLHNRT